MVDPLFQPSLLLLPRMYFLKEHTGSKISYFGDNNLLLLQFKPGGNDDKNHSEHLRDNKKQTLRFWSSFQLPVLPKSSCFKGCFNQVNFYDFQTFCQGKVAVEIS